MLANALKSCSLVSSVTRGLVYLPKKRRDMFQKSLAPEDYEMDPLPPLKHHKPRRPEWSDPNVVWPPVLPAATKLKGKSLLKELEFEERDKLSLLKPYTIPDFRSGDIIKFHYLHSLSEGKGNEFNGLCLGVSKRNSLHANFWVIVRVTGEPTIFNIKLHSPFLAKLEIVHRGSGNHRAKLFSMVDKMKRNSKFNTPLIKGVSKARKGEVKVEIEKPENESVIYDKIEI